MVLVDSDIHGLFQLVEIEAAFKNLKDDPPSA